MKKSSNVIKTRSKGRGMKHSLNAVLAVVACIVLASISAYAAQQQVPVPKEHKSQNPTVKPDTITPMTNIQQGIAVTIPLQAPINLLSYPFPSLCSILDQAARAVQQKRIHSSECVVDKPQGMSGAMGMDYPHSWLFITQNSCCNTNKSYSIPDQQAAGCLSTDTIPVCQEKLVRHCIRNANAFGQMKDTYNKEKECFNQLSQKNAQAAQALQQFLSVLP